MNIKHKGLFVTSALALAAGFFWGPGIVGSFAAPVEFTGQGNPVDSAQTIDNLTTSADLVVQARVINRKNRVVSEVLPVYAEDAVTVLEQREMKTPFTDVTLEVVDTLKGKSAPVITVLQNGGTLKQNRLGRAQSFSIAGDPLLEVGSEHFLFLVEITGDGVHSTGRKLYRVVNPMGRYEILSSGELRGPDAYEAVGKAVRASLPKWEGELRDQLGAALPRSEENLSPES